MFDFPYLPHCIIAPMHQCMIIHMHGHGKTKKELKTNHNLTYEEQTMSKQRNKDIYMWNQARTKAYQTNKIKKQKQNGLDQGFWARICVTYIGPPYAAQLYAGAYFKYACACTKHAYAYTP